MDITGFYQDGGRLIAPSPDVPPLARIYIPVLRQRCNRHDRHPVRQTVPDLRMPPTIVLKKTSAIPVGESWSPLVALCVMVFSENTVQVDNRSVIVKERVVITEPQEVNRFII